MLYFLIIYICAYNVLYRYVIIYIKKISIGAKYKFGFTLYNRLDGFVFYCWDILRWWGGLVKTFLIFIFYILAAICFFKRTFRRRIASGSSDRWHFFTKTSSPTWKILHKTSYKALFVLRSGKVFIKEKNVFFGKYLFYIVIIYNTLCTLVVVIINYKGVVIKKKLWQNFSFVKKKSFSYKNKLLHY